MGSGNRVEELEERVKQLEASVTGLTDELVECKERLRALEDEVDPEMDIIEGQPTRTGDDADDAAETDRSKPAEGNGEESTDSDGDEIIVA